MSFENPVLHLALWRKAAGKSQEKLAEEIDYARGYIAKCETRPQNVTLEFLIAFARGVGAPSVIALFTTPDDVSLDAKELLQYWSSLGSEADRQTVLSIAKSLSITSNGEGADDRG